MRKYILPAIVCVEIYVFISLIYMVVHLADEKQLLVNLANATKLITWSCTEYSEIPLEYITDYSAQEIAEKNDFYKVYRCRFIVSNDSDYDIVGIEVCSLDGMVEMNLHPFTYCDGTCVFGHENATGDDYAYLFTHKPTDDISEVLSDLRVLYTFDVYDRPSRIFSKDPSPMHYYAYYQP